MTHPSAEADGGMNAGAAAMNARYGDAGGHRGRGRARGQAGAMAAGAAGIALLIAACGGGSASSAGSPGRSNLQIAIGYAKCMRSHGAPNWPDPNSQGQFLKTKA